MPEELTMARPKKGQKKVERPADERVAIIHLKGTAEYAEWLDDLHRETLVSKAALIRLGLSMVAEKYGIKRRPPEM